jgi:hypothetical protein
MAKVNLTPQQITQYLLSGGDLNTLADKANISQQQLLAVLVSNPKILESYRQKASAVSRGLDKYVPYSDKSIYSEDPSVYQVNEYQQQYDMMEPAAKELANAYFQSYAQAGGNPIRIRELNTIFDDPVTAQRYGIPEDARFSLLDQVKKDAPKWFAREMDVKRGNEMANYKAFQAQRKALNMREGESPTAAALRGMTGFGEFADLPKQDLSFEDIAKQNAARKYVSERQKVIEKLPATRVDAYLESKQSKAKGLEQSSAVAESNRKLYEKAFLNAAKKKFGAKATPYSAAISQVLPAIAARLKIEG